MANELFAYFAAVRSATGEEDLTRLPVNVVACFHDGLTPDDVATLVMASQPPRPTPKRTPRWARRVVR